MASQYTHRRRIEFSETDMAGIVHFSRFFVFMESAEHAFFRSLGYSIHGRIKDVQYSWPRLEARCDYKFPLRFEDEIDIHLSIREITSKTILYSFLFEKVEGEELKEIAQGEIRVICVSVDEDTNTMRSVSIPAEIRNQLETAPQFADKSI